MTKTQWNQVLNELKNIRTTNKFHTTIMCRVSRGKELRIDSVNTEHQYLLLEGRVVIKHTDVLDVSPKEFKEGFYITLPLFSIRRIQFKPV